MGKGLNQMSIISKTSLITKGHSETRLWQEKISIIWYKIKTNIINMIQMKNYSNLT